jgi:hypothetical protein
VGIKRRLGELEARIQTEARRGETPSEVSVLLKVVARQQAREEGKETPPYTQEEIEEMRRDDLKIAAGDGVVGWLREGAGWRSKEARAKLDEWEQDAHRRIEQAQNLPPERWSEVWGVDD